MNQQDAGDNAVGKMAGAWMKTPRVSVLIPTYNFARFLPEAIESVLAQDFEDYELLIVDDCSQDGSAEVLARFAARDPRIRYKVNSPNMGMVQNWNYCMSLARGEYIKFLFGDDKFADRQALGKLVAILDSDPGVALAVSARKIIDEKSKWVDTWDHLGSAGYHDGKRTIMRCLIDLNLIGEPSVVLFRKSQALRGFNPKYRQIVDLEMWFHLLEQGDLVYTREKLCCFRKHSQQQTVFNNMGTLVQTEHFLLAKKYSDHSWFGANASTKDRLGFVHSLRRMPETTEITAFKEKHLDGISGAVRYIYWIWKKLTRPFENLNKSVRKRWIRFGLLFSQTQC